MMGYGGGWGSMGWTMGSGWIFGFILLLIVVAAIVWIVRSFLPEGGRLLPPVERGSSALTILEERYARGEIDRDEYLQKKQDLLARGEGKPGR